MGASATRGTRVGPARAKLGEIRFTIEIAGRHYEVWIRTELPIVPSADATLPATLLAAMTQGGWLRLSDPIDPRLRANIDEIQSFYADHAADWQRWPVGPPRRIAVDAPGASSPPASSEGRVGAFFSAGIDSMLTALEAPEVTDLIFIGGFDTPHDRPELIEATKLRMEAAAIRLGKRLVVVDTNLRDLYWDVSDWNAGYGAVLAAVALAIAPAFRRIYVSSGPPDSFGRADGSHRRLDPLWSTAALETVRYGGELTRAAKLARIADHELVRDSLRVCMDESSDSNCGRCKKCVRAMLLLEALGLGGRLPFPPVLDLGAATEIDARRATPRLYMDEGLARAMERHPDRDLVEAFGWMFWGRPFPEHPPDISEREREEGLLRVNLHLAADNGETARRGARLVAELAATTRQRLKLQPLLSAELERDAAALVFDHLRGLELNGAPPLVIARPMRLCASTLEPARRLLGRADLTLTASSRIASASELLGVPAAMLSDEPAATSPAPAREPRAREAGAEQAAMIQLLLEEQRDLRLALERLQLRARSLEELAASRAVELERVHRSASWRLTSPLRAAKRTAHGRRDAP